MESRTKAPTEEPGQGLHGSDQVEHANDEQRESRDEQRQRKRTNDEAPHKILPGDQTSSHASQAEEAAEGPKVLDPDVRASS